VVHVCVAKGPDFFVSAALFNIERHVPIIWDVVVKVCRRVRPHQKAASASQKRRNGAGHVGAKLSSLGCRYITSDWAGLIRLRRSTAGLERRLSYYLSVTVVRPIFAWFVTSWRTPSYQNRKFYRQIQRFLAYGT
jgi:hypothetical protein